MLIFLRGGEKCIQNCGWESEGKRIVRRSRYRWEDNIKMDLKEIGWEVVGWVELRVRDLWRGVVNKVFNACVHKRR
jgi:hypothetical protein